MVKRNSDIQEVKQIFVEETSKLNAINNELRRELEEAIKSCQSKSEQLDHINISEITELSQWSTMNEEPRKAFCWLNDNSVVVKSCNEFNLIDTVN